MTPDMLDQWGEIFAAGQQISNAVTRRAHYRAQGMTEATITALNKLWHKDMRALARYQKLNEPAEG